MLVAYKPLAKHWAAAAMLATKKNFRRVMGHKDMWALKVILDGEHQKTLTVERKVFTMLIPPAQKVPLSPGEQALPSESAPLSACRS